MTLRRDAPTATAERCACDIGIVFLVLPALAPIRWTPIFIFRRMDEEAIYIVFLINKCDAALLQRFSPEMPPVSRNQAYPAPRAARATLSARSQKPQSLIVLGIMIASLIIVFIMFGKKKIE